MESDPFWHDRKSADINEIRTGCLIRDADIVVIRFGKKYKQWKAAFEAGIAHTLGESVILLQGGEHDHALKRIFRTASVVCCTPKHFSTVIAYVVKGVINTKTIPDL